MLPELNKINHIIKKNEILSFSIEITPSVTEDEMNKLTVEPAFVAVTWHAKSHQCKNLDIEPIQKAIFLRSKQQNVLLHLSCDMLTIPYLDELIALLQEKGICNLFVMLGESFDPSSSDFRNSSELIKYIREKSGNYFSIGIAGFLESSEEKLLQMKKKIECGADFIVTQAFFEFNEFQTFVEKCKKVGIDVPIIPGIYAFETYAQLNKFINLCKVKVSSALLENVKNKQDADMPGIEITKKLVRTIRSELKCAHFHFFTLNHLGETSDLIKQLQSEI